jgi:hypothetical protein
VDGLGALLAAADATARVYAASTLANLAHDASPHQQVGCCTATRNRGEIVTLRDNFGWEIAHEAVSRRPPVSLDRVVARTGGYAYDVGVWDLSIVQGPFSVTCQTLELRFATFFIAVCCLTSPPLVTRTASSVMLTVAL